METWLFITKPQPKLLRELDVDRSHFEQVPRGIRQRPPVILRPSCKQIPKLVLVDSLSSVKWLTMDQSEDPWSVVLAQLDHTGCMQSRLPFGRRCGSVAE